jgi:CBS domain-containing protein
MRMKVKDIMETNVVAIDKNTSYEEVARILYENNISATPVLEADGTVIGIVSEKDIFRILYPFYRSFYDQPILYSNMEEREQKAQEIRNHKAELFMNRNIIPVSPDDPIMRAGAIMLAKHISRLPVVKDGKVVGIISRKMIYRAILKENFNFNGNS